MFSNTIVSETTLRVVFLILRHPIPELFYLFYFIFYIFDNANAGYLFTLFTRFWNARLFIYTLFTRFRNAGYLFTACDLIKQIRPWHPSWFYSIKNRIEGLIFLWWFFSPVIGVIQRGGFGFFRAAAATECINFHWSRTEWWLWLF